MAAPCFIVKCYAREFLKAIHGLALSRSVHTIEGLTRPRQAMIFKAIGVFLYLSASRADFGILYGEAKRRLAPLDIRAPAHWSAATDRRHLLAELIAPFTLGRG